MTPSAHRFSLLVLMALVAVIALGLAALHDPSPAALIATSSITTLILFAALLGAIVRPAPAASFRGFALFGWGYILLGVVPQSVGPTLAGMAGLASWAHPARWLVGVTVARLHPVPVEPDDPFPDQGYEPTIDENKALCWWPRKNGDPLIPLSPEEVKKWKDFEARRTHYQANLQKNNEEASRARDIGHALSALVFGFVGAIVGRVLEGPRRLAPRSLVPNPIS